MPTKKIGDINTKFCQDPNHNPPTMMVWEDGIYQHTCPTCKVKQVFTVMNPRM